MHPREVAVVGAVVIMLVVPWIVIRDVWSHPVARWRAADRSRVATSVFVAVVPLVGPAWYLRRIRPEIRGPERVTPWRRFLRLVGLGGRPPTS